MGIAGVKTIATKICFRTVITLHSIELTFYVHTIES